jgi:hypothetical protein
MNYLFDDCCQFENLDRGTWFVCDRYMIQRTSEIDWECWTVEILALSQVVDEVKNHPCALHEGQAKNGVDRDVRTCGNQQQRVFPCGCLVGKVKLEAHLQLSGDGFVLMGLNDCG